MALFDIPQEEPVVPASHRQLYEILKKPKKYGKLWDEQGQAFTKLEESEANGDADALITMPTGTGKTIVGLVAARLGQLRRRERVLFLTPNNALARQVMREAEKVSIPWADLTGKYSEVPDDAKQAYRNGAAIGVASYQVLFNPTPAVPPPSTIILDDVHAADDAIASPWTLDIKDGVDGGGGADLFTKMRGLIEVMAPELEWPSSASPRKSNYVTLIPHRDWRQIQVVLAARLSSWLEGNSGIHGWVWENKLRDLIHATFCFISKDRIQIRPWLAPTSHLEHFANADRRIYLSATVDRIGHLERLVGREGVTRIEPESIEIPGRRLVIQAQALLPDLDEFQMAVHMASRFDKSLVLTPSGWHVDRFLEAVAEHGLDHEIVVTLKEDDLDQFGKADRAILVLANHYDGLDLGGDQCNHVILIGSPAATNMQDLFLQRQWHAKEATLSRARQRLVQGIGRCTRDKDDRAVVSLCGADIVDLATFPRVYNALPRILRGELEASNQFKNPAELDELLEAFHNNHEKWTNFHDHFKSKSRGFPAPVQEDGQVLAAHTAEVAFSGNMVETAYMMAYDRAVAAANEAHTNRLDKQAACWHYLASVAADMAGEQQGEAPWTGQGTNQVQEAVAFALGRPWFGALGRYTTLPAPPEEHRRQVASVVALLKGTSRSDLSGMIQSTMAGLKQNEAGPYEKSLTSMGRLLGFEALKPKRDGAPDSIWHQGKECIAIFEAKTDKEEKSRLSMLDVRQMRDQPGEVAGNEKLNVADDLPVYCVTTCRRVAKEKDQTLDGILMVDPGRLRKWAGRACSRISFLSESRHLPDAFLEGMVWRQLEAGNMIPGALTEALGADPAENVLQLV